MNRQFDYSGSQALKALKEEGIETVLINPNIATIQTSERMAGTIYFLPINAFFVEKVIEKEKPDAILLGFGGQTALNCGIELEKNGVLKKHSVKVLGTSIATIIDTEDRELFKKRLFEIGVKTPRSIACNAKEQAFEAVKQIGFPVIVRAGYTLGGQGSGKAENMLEFEDTIEKAFASSPQVLVEEYLSGWKEIEYEVVRDKFDNCITVCNMENLDPMGIHTGESIVVAPSQTMTNQEYHFLREISIKTIKHLGIVGECNIQFALSPETGDYRVIEVNARLSRSSALASKATGYPLAFVAAKLAMGKGLLELKNSVTKTTTAFFEPALDYIVIKMPRWDFQKFRNVSTRLGSEMKSVGEVMAIGRNFEEAFQKAVRMTDTGVPGVTHHNINNFSDIEKELSEPTDKRIFAIETALRKGYSVQSIHSLSKISEWFIAKIKNIVDFDKKLQKETIATISKNTLKQAKKFGFSDSQIALSLNCAEEELFEKRKYFGIRPAIKQIDTLAAEYPAQTNYLYLTYSDQTDDIEISGNKKAMVLGSGPYRIGSSVEFDWCGVNAVKTLQALGYSVGMINCNPETVSTDYDECDRLFFDELSFETVREIFEKEKPEGIVLSTGGQIPNNLAMKCYSAGMHVFGTSPKSIDSAEDRHKFSKLCDELGIDQPEWKELSNMKEALSFAEKTGYPVLVRPSYVLSGAAMNVAFTGQQLEEYLLAASNISREHPVIITKFILGAKELEIDAVADNGKLIAFAITEHIENAGVHSGDATIVLPPQKVYTETSKRIIEIAEKLAGALQITGPFNVQFLAVQNNVKVIECNLRASRSFPFVSKVLGENFIDLAVKAMLGLKPKPIGEKQPNYVGVKAPQFSFSRLRGADPILRVEMASTGEVACLGKDLEDALLKSLISSGFKLPKKNILLSVSGNKYRFEMLSEIKTLKELGYSLFATTNTHKFLEEQGIDSMHVFKVSENKQPNISDLLKEKKLDLVVVISQENISKEKLQDEYFLRRKSIDFGIPLITNIQLAKTIISAIPKYSLEQLETEPWDYYLKQS